MAEGILDQVSIGVESAVGTAVTPTVSLAVLPSDGVVTEEEAVGVEAIDTSPAKNKDFVMGLREYNGSFEMNAYPQAIGYVFKSALGASSSPAVNGETLVHKHTITESVTKKSYTLEQKIGSFIERFAGFTVGSFTLSLKVGESVKISFTGKAITEADAVSAITPVYEASKVFDWTDVVSISLGGTDIKSVIDSLSMEYVNGLNSFHGCDGQAEPSALYVENSEVSGSFTAYLNTAVDALKDKFKDKSEQALVITITGDETIGSASHNSLVITLPKVVLNTYTHNIDTSYVAVECEYVGAKDPTNGLIKVELTNLVEAY